MCKTPLLAAVLAVALPSAALAETPRGAAWKVGHNSYHLYLGDLDLGTAAGRAQALARAERAAAKLCCTGMRAERERCVARTVEAHVTGSAAPKLKMALDERASRHLAWRDAPKP